MTAAPVVEDPDPKLIGEAQRCQPVTCGRQLRAMRELAGLSQAELAAASGITAPALSQAEHSETRLSARHLAAMAAHLRTPMEAFVARPEPQIQLPPQLRQPRRVPARAQRRAAQVASAVVRLREALTGWVQLPEPWPLSCPVDAAAPAEVVSAEIEAAAVSARQALGIEDGAPPGSLMRRLAAAGVVVVRDGASDTTVGVFSAIIDNQPVIVTGPGDIWDQDNFDLAHELGHIVMHRGSPHRPGRRNAEQQAHRFAAALLAPEPVCRREIPTELDWGRYLALKHRLWMPMASIVERAHNLGIVTPAQRKAAVRHRSARGWDQQEPGHSLRSAPAAEPLARAVRLADVGVDELSGRALLPAWVVSMLCESPAALPDL